MRKSLHGYLALIFTFLIGIHQGNVALWQEGRSEPVAVFPCRAELLPPADRQALEAGIRVSSEEELHRLLEDFLS